MTGLHWPIACDSIWGVLWTCSLSGVVMCTARLALFGMQFLREIVMRFEWRRFWDVLIVVGVSLLAATLGLSCAARTQERKTTVASSELPASIETALRRAFPQGEILAVEREVEGEDPGQYDVDVRSAGTVYEVEVSPDGRIVEAKEKPSTQETAPDARSKRWTDTFSQEDCTFASTGQNRFFSLQPGHRLVLQGARERVVITVLDEIQTVGGVETRVVEEREEENGKLKEVSRNFFAICKEHGDVFYFGEEVDDYEDGKIVRHSGAWRADEKGSKAGIIMPGTILLGACYYQEIAPNAKDRAENLADDVTLKTPAGTFKNCLRVEETSGLDPGEKSYKTYAPGIGLIQDEDLLLVEYSEGK